jgi:hypothetical protein
MKQQSKFSPMPMKAVENNVSQGKYTPKFFELAGLNLNRVVFSSHFFDETDVEKEIVLGNYSFAYLRESKLRTVDIYDSDGAYISFERFVNRIGIAIESKNLFKTGKYLSRVFRPAKYGMFFSGLDIHINKKPLYAGKITDGISLISLNLAKELGWINAEVNKSAQFTLLFKGGLVKGHCVVSDKIEHDIVIYGQDNIRDEISFTRDCAYVAIEPVKLSTTLRMDIQSLLNLWELIGDKQCFSWAVKGIESFKRDLLSGKLAEQLDDFDDITREKYEEQTWLLKKAIWHKLDYRRFPGLMRLAWQMYRNSISRYGCRGGFASFRIPVAGGIRAYLRVDLRDHDGEGNFEAKNSCNNATVDKYGNLWVQPEEITELTRILGGADEDDNISIVPLEDGKALLYRNPNQRGEYVITNISYEGIEVTDYNKLVGSIPQKPVETAKKEVATATDNPLINLYLSAQIEFTGILPYTKANLLRTFNKIAQNSANIGIVANAEMIRSAIGITEPALARKLTRLYSWNLERVIDSVVKDGVSCGEDLSAVESLISYVAENGVELPKCLLNRIPESKREKTVFVNAHPVDKLLEAVMFVVNQADKEILGSGSVSKGNRVPGAIDKCDVPLIEIAESNFDNPLFDAAMDLLKRYNKRMAILLDSTKDYDEFEREQARKAGIEEIQRSLLSSMNVYAAEERLLIVKAWAYEIYKGDKAVHDSILWISSIDELQGTGDDTIEMLANIGLSAHVKKNGGVTRYTEIKRTELQLLPIRVWSKEFLSAEKFTSLTEILIQNKTVLVGDRLLNLGEECQLGDGVYSIRNIRPCYSRKNPSHQLKNSIVVLLKYS